MALIGAIDHPRRGHGRLERLFSASIVVCLAVTGLVMLPEIDGHAVLPTVDLVLDTIALVAAGMLTALAWVRLREQREGVAAYHAAAFLALFVAYGIALIISLAHGESVDRLAEPENPQILVFAVAQMAAAVLFGVAGTRIGRHGPHIPSALLLALTALTVISAAVIGMRLDPPPLGLDMITVTDATGLPTITPFGAAVHLLTGSLFFAGAYASRGLWRRTGSAIDGWIAIGLVFAGFAELQWTLYPSAHPGQVSTADVLWLACSVALLLGLDASVRDNVRELRAANLELATLRDSEVERAALEERARLARELHDGLAQDLWLAKLRTGQVAAMDGLPPDARRAMEEAGAAIDSGLSDAREAVATLRDASHENQGFCNLIRSSVEDFGDRFGLRVEFAFDGQHTSRIAARTQAEVLRITQEALANVGRHAEATIVGVRLSTDGDRIRIRVVDNGRGFDPARPTPGSFGLASMRERAALIGGRLRVVSRPGAGTRVVLTAPFAPSLAGADPVKVAHR